jgi:hypothetical protein
MQRNSPMTAVLGSAYDAFLDGVEQAGADGTLLMAMTMWAVAATKPA